MDPQNIRFGFTDSIHLLPLLHPLLAGWVYPNGFKLELVAMAPQELNEAVASGALDGAFLEPVYFAKLRSSVEPLPGIGLASEGANGAAVLQSRERADNLDGGAIALSPNAVNGMGEVLTKVLLQPFFGIDAKVAPASADAPDQEAPSAQVLVGDQATQARLPWLVYEAQFSQPEDESRYNKNKAPALISEPDPATAGYIQDLGSAWWVLTGTPLVWSLAAVRQEMLAHERVVVDLVRAFRDSRRSAQEQFDTIVTTAAKRIGAPESAIRAVFAAQTVDIGTKEQGGLGIFYDHTKRLRIT